MTVRAPRRIFRASPAARAARLLSRLAGGLAVAGALGAGARALHDAPAPPAKARAGQSTRLTAGAGDVTVVDGDTLRLHDRVVRLFGITTPGHGQNCGRTDGGPAIDCGSAAADALATLVRAGRVDCATRETDAMGRPVANCAAGGTDLAHALVAAGWARVVYAVPDLTALEAQARHDRRGYWAIATATW